jgi:hypothetical protein
MADISGDIQQRGFTLVPKLVSPLETAHLKVFFDDAKMARTERGGDTYGARNLLALNEIKQISASSQIATYLAPLLGSKFQAVRGIFFDKTENANWPVLWHQDLSLAVKARHDISGWAGWSVKRGIPHVQAPAAILEKIISIIALPKMALCGLSLGAMLKDDFPVRPFKPSPQARKPMSSPPKLGMSCSCAL